jgi:superoxide dismutase, Cu-Zn family
MFARMKLRPLLALAIAAVGIVALTVYWGGLNGLKAAENAAESAVVSAKLPTVGAEAVVRDAKGAEMALVTFRDAGAGKVSVRVVSQKLPPGFHGFHVHAVGKCDPNATDATGKKVPFASAGGHFDKRSTQHPNQSGDLPVLLINSDGSGLSTVTTTRFTINDLFPQGGTSVIVHAAADNFANIPNRFSDVGGTPGPDADTLKTGDAGGRIGCGVIRRKR